MFVESNKSEREIRTLESRYDRDVHAPGTHRERVHVKYGNFYNTWMSYIKHVQHFKVCSHEPKFSPIFPLSNFCRRKIIRFTSVSSCLKEENSSGGGMFGFPSYYHRSHDQEDLPPGGSALWGSGGLCLQGALPPGGSASRGTGLHPGLKSQLHPGGLGRPPPPFYSEKQQT